MFLFPWENHPFCLSFGYFFFGSRFLMFVFVFFVLDFWVCYVCFDRQTPDMFSAFEGRSPCVCFFNVFFFGGGITLVVALVLLPWV